MKDALLCSFLCIGCGGDEEQAALDKADHTPPIAAAAEVGSPADSPSIALVYSDRMDQAEQVHSSPGKSWQSDLRKAVLLWQLLHNDRRTRGDSKADAAKTGIKPA